MRIVVDALAASHGGLATHVRGILTTWAEVAPGDELTVLVTQPFAAEIASDPRCASHRLLSQPTRRPSVAWRVARAELLLPTVQTNADVLLSTIPTLPALWRRPTVAIVSDLRHEDRPTDYSVSRRLGRKILFGSAFRRADRLLAISERTAASLRAWHPDTIPRTAVVYFGADHVAERCSTRDGDAIAFGQYAAKEAGLLTRAWQILLATYGASSIKLHIVGLSAEQRESLSREAKRLAVSDRVILDPYLETDRLDELFRRARAILVPSRYEGFGFPVLEAMRQGIPVMISPDPALQEVAAGNAACASSWAPNHLADAIHCALSMTPQQVETSQLHAKSFTWRRTVESMRANLQVAVGRRH